MQRLITYQPGLLLNGGESQMHWGKRKLKDLSSHPVRAVFFFSFSFLTEAAERPRGDRGGNGHEYQDGGRSSVTEELPAAASTTS